MSNMYPVTLSPCVELAVNACISPVSEVEMLETLFDDPFQDLDFDS